MAVIGKYVLGNSEVKKYSVDYSGWLSTGELLVGVTFDVGLVTTPALTITDSVIDDTGAIVTFYAQGGDGKSVIPVGINITTSFAQIKTDTINFASQVALGPGAPAGSLNVPPVVVGIFGTPTSGQLAAWSGSNVLTSGNLTGEVNTVGFSSTINRAITPAWTGLHSFNAGIASITGTPLSLGASPIPNAFLVTQNYPAATLGSPGNWNTFVINDSYVYAGALSGWSFIHAMAAGAGGNRMSMAVSLELNAQPNHPVGSSQLSALFSQGVIQPNVNAGGSAIFGLNSQIVINSGVTNLAAGYAQESDLFIAGGVTAPYYAAHRMAVTLVPGQTTSSRGTKGTSGISFVSETGALGFSEFLLIGPWEDVPTSNQSPFGPSGQANGGAVITTRHNPSIKYGVDLTGAVPLGTDHDGWAFGSPNYIVDWFGNVLNGQTTSQQYLTIQGAASGGFYAYDRNGANSGYSLLYRLNNVGAIFDSVLGGNVAQWDTSGNWSLTGNLSLSSAAAATLRFPFSGTNNVTLPGGALGGAVPRLLFQYASLPTNHQNNLVTFGTTATWASTTFSLSYQGMLVSMIDPNGVGSLFTALKTSDWTTGSYDPNCAMRITAHDNASFSGDAIWGTYDVAERTVAASAAHEFFQREYSFHNLGASVVSDPFNVNPAGFNTNLRLDSGVGHVSGNPVTNAIDILNNGAQYNAAINIGSTALVTVGGLKRAMQLAEGNCLAWYHAAGSTSGALYVDTGSFFQVIAGGSNFTMGGVLSAQINSVGVKALLTTDATSSTSAPLLSAGGLGVAKSAWLGTFLAVAGNQVVGPRATGWTVATGTPSRATFTTSGVSLATLAGVVMALEQDLIAHGLIGT